jgi:hypothetical protein
MEETTLARPMGRPPKGPEDRTVSLTFTVPVFLYEQMQAIAKRDLSTMAQLVRTALLHEIERRKGA